MTRTSCCCCSRTFERPSTCNKFASRQVATQRQPTVADTDSVSATVPFMASASTRDSLVRSARDVHAAIVLGWEATGEQGRRRRAALQSAAANSAAEMVNTLSRLRQPKACPRRKRHDHDKPSRLGAPIEPCSPLRYREQPGPAKTPAPCGSGISKRRRNELLLLESIECGVDAPECNISSGRFQRFLREGASKRRCAGQTPSVAERSLDS